MAQVDVMFRESGDMPVVLLDDVMSELDRGRQENISMNMKKAQIILTGTEKTGPISEGARYYLVENGQITLTPT